MKIFAIGAAVAAAAAALLPARDASAENWSSDLRITSVTAAGSECPAQTPTVTYSQGQRALLITLPASISAAVGPGRSLSESNAFCMLSVGFEARPGYRFAITRAKYHGQASLDAGVMGMQTITHWFMGSERGRFTTTLTGPYRGGYQRDQTAAPVAWSSCTADRRLNIDFDVSVSNIANPQGRGTLSTGPGVYQLGLTWAPCDGSYPPDIMTLEPWVFPRSPDDPP